MIKLLRLLELLVIEVCLLLTELLQLRHLWHLWYLVIVCHLPKADVAHIWEVEVRHPRGEAVGSIVGGDAWCCDTRGSWHSWNL